MSITLSRVSTRQTRKYYCVRYVADLRLSIFRYAFLRVDLTTSNLHLYLVYWMGLLRLKSIPQCRLSLGTGEPSKTRTPSPSGSPCSMAMPVVISRRGLVGSQQNHSRTAHTRCLFSPLWRPVRKSGLSKKVIDLRRSHSAPVEAQTNGILAPRYTA